MAQSVNSTSCSPERVLDPAHRTGHSAAWRWGLGFAERLVRNLYALATTPVSVLFILRSDRIHPSYKMTTARKLALGFRMLYNKCRIPTGTSFKAHLAMALKILETPPDVEGEVVECGTWKGGSAANLSLVCRIAHRRLRIFDSFEGLPEGDPGDNEAGGYSKGDYCGTLEEVKSNLARYGALECCELVKGWFSQSLPHQRSPVLLAFLDVDLEESLETCVKNIWPRLLPGGYLFIDECVGLNYCALFFSESWWWEHFNQLPPGLIGAGTGLPLGEFYIGPWPEIAEHPLQHASTGAYTRRNFTAYWSFRPQARNRQPPDSRVAGVDP